DLLPPASHQATRLGADAAGSCPAFHSRTPRGSPVQMSKNELLERVREIAQRAGEVVMQVYATDFAVRGKDDASPVTEADERAEAVIVSALHALTPEVPIVAEEAVAAGRTPDVGE